MPGIRIIAFAAAALVLWPFAASAQAWPSRPVTMIVPFPAGGTADLLARGVARALSDELGQQFVVENRAGAGGNTGAAAVARAAPDGYSLVFGAAYNAQLFLKELPFDPVKDIAPISVVGVQYYFLLTSRGAGVKTLGEFINKAKAAPGKVTIGIRPRALMPVKDAAPDALTSRAELIEPMGAETLVHARTGTGCDIRVVVPREAR